jgi:hypothetical protein
MTRLLFFYPENTISFAEARYLKTSQATWHALAVVFGPKQLSNLSSASQPAFAVAKISPDQLASPEGKW